MASSASGVSGRLYAPVNLEAEISELPAGVPEEPGATLGFEDIVLDEGEAPGASLLPGLRRME